MALHVFEGFGIEIEWSIVDAKTLAPRSLADAVLRGPTGMVDDEIDRGEARWSNELARHVVEVKTAGPVADLRPVGPLMLEQARTIDALLADKGACLLGGAMHPLLDPKRDVELWPYGQRDIYEAYDRIFDCRRHGWLNLQSVHLNLAFAGDEELARLHDAVRLVLPLIPAIAAASPFVGGKYAGHLDHRVAVYRDNQKRVPAIAGRVIPERVQSRAEYEAVILKPMYKAIAPLDADHLLQEEWLNSRGAIVRFDRSAIEIRLIDAQETPTVDVAIAGGVVAVLRALVEGKLPGGMTGEDGTERLRAMLDRTVTDAEDAVIDDLDYLAALGLRRAPTSAHDVWVRLLEVAPAAPEHMRQLHGILEHGTLARRMLDAVGEKPTARTLRSLCRELAEALPTGELFVP